MPGTKNFEYQGHEIVVPEATGPRPRLTIDGISYRYGQDAAEKYYLHDYAYDRRKRLEDVIKRFIGSALFSGKGRA